MRNAKADDNQPQIVKALRKAGASVQTLHAVGHGCPDLAVGFRGMTFLIEVKDGGKPPSKRVLTPAQVQWHQLWAGHVAIAETEEQALKIIGALG